MSEPNQTTGRIITSGTNRPPAEVSTQWQYAPPFTWWCKNITKRLLTYHSFCKQLRSSFCPTKYYCNTIRHETMTTNWRSHTFYSYVFLSFTFILYAYIIWIHNTLINAGCTLFHSLLSLYDFDLTYDTNTTQY
jgi:hypothetical protein